MKTFKITFLPENTTVNVSENVYLLEAEILAGLHPDAPCGGLGLCGKCRVRITDDQGTRIAPACQVKIHSDLTVQTNLPEEIHILTAGTGRHLLPEPPFPVPADLADTDACVAAAAFDIGTTTLAGYLVDARTGMQLACASMQNPQSSYGADVISRSSYALEHGEAHLSEPVRLALQSLLNELCSMAAITLPQIYLVTLVGNTCMHHLFLGLSTDCLVRAPYMPKSRDMRFLNPSDYGIRIHPQGQLVFLPCIAGFVGADTVGCLLSCDLLHEERMTLMVDIGTNGEIALGNRNRIVACSTAAGPALEGAKISCGMRGARGAIQHILKTSDGDFSLDVIGDGSAHGLCGSGLLDAIAWLLDAGVLEPSGHLKSREELLQSGTDRFSDRLIQVEEKPAFAFTGQVSLTQQDIREVQLAKGAIAAGIDLLCRYLEISAEQIDQVLIAGAFGNYMNPESACAIGMLPPKLLSKIAPIGNAAGEGAKAAALNKTVFEEAVLLMEKVEFLELAGLPAFQDVFVEHLCFPGFDEEDEE